MPEVTQPPEENATLVDWTSVTTCQNLRILEIKHQVGGSPTFEQLANLLASSPMLEVLDITGYCPTAKTLPIQTRTLLIQLPALKRLAFGWSRVDLACDFLKLFQISETLETLELTDMESGLGLCKRAGSGLFDYNGDSSEIFKTLTSLASGRSKEELSSPRISTLGLKNLSVSWVKSDTKAVSAFLRGAPMIKEIRLTDVDEGVLNGIAAHVIVGPLGPQSPKVGIQWIWNGRNISDSACMVTSLLEGLGDDKLQVSIERFGGNNCGFTPIALKARLDDGSVGWGS